MKNNLIKDKIIILLYKIKRFFKGKNILLIPPANLDGSFGDELMTITFIENFKNVPITIYLENNYKREDLFEEYKNIKFVNWRESIRIIDFTDVYVLGADIMTGSYGENDPLFKIKLLNKASYLGINNAILGFSLKDGMSKSIIDSLNSLSANTKLFLRDVDSYERALKVLFKKNIFNVVDLAFLTKAKVVEDLKFNLWLENNKNNIVIGFCPNAIQAKKVSYNKYVHDLEILLKYALNKGNVSIVLLYHDLRNHCDGKSDKDISNEIFNKLFISYKDKIFFPKNIKNGLELKFYLENISFTLTGRMHMGISGYSLGKPMLGIAYEGKFSGLQKIFDIDAERTLITDLYNIHNSLDSLDYMISSLDYLKKSVEEKLPMIKRLSKNNFI